MFLLGAMVIWGANIPVIKFLAVRFEPITLACIRMGCACAVFAAIACLRRSSRVSLVSQHWKTVLSCGVLMVYLNQVLLTKGVVLTTATKTALIVALSPLVSSLLSAFVFREPMTMARCLGIAVGLIGVVGVILYRPGAQLEAAGIGDALVFLSILTFAIGGVLVQQLARDLDVITISLSIYTVGTLLLTVHALVGGFDAGIFFPHPLPWSLILFSGVAATALGNLVWNKSIGVLGIGRTGLYLNWVPLFAIGAAVLFLGEPLSWPLVVGFVCVVTGTWMGAMQKFVVQGSQ